MKNIADQHVGWTGWEVTRRNAIVHWTEAPPGLAWQVLGEHWLNRNGIIIKLGTELVSDCSIYDGWWDVNI